MRKLTALLLAVIFSFSMVACGSSEPSNNEEDNIPKITMPYDESHYTGTDRPHYLVAKELEELGFTNITFTEVEDGFFYYSVENVKIF